MVLFFGRGGGGGWGVRRNHSVLLTNAQCNHTSNRHSDLNYPGTYSMKTMSVDTITADM